MWAQAKRMQRLWNHLCDMHEVTRRGISDQTPEDVRKAKWEKFNGKSLAACKVSGLKHECDKDVLDRFTKACVAATREPGRRWPRPRGLSVSMRHRVTGGGAPVRRLTGRAQTARFDGTVVFDATERPRHASVKGGDSRYRYCQFQLNNGELIQFCAQVHEPINPLAIVKSIRWIGRRDAFGWHWWIVIQTEEPPVERARTGRSCGINLGWRKRDDALRVAFLVDNAGRRQEYLLPLDFSTRDSRRQRARRPDWTHAPDAHAELRELQRLRDLRLEELKAELKTMLSPLPLGFEKMRGRGLVRLLGTLPDAESAARARIQTWHDQDRPLYHMQARASERFANRRRDLYGNYASEIAKAYDEIFIDKGDMARMVSDKNRDESRDPALKAADRYHQIAAPGDFRACLLRAAKKFGAKVILKDSLDLSRTCSECSGKMSHGPALMQSCENGHVMDQDENAAKNILSQNTPVFVQRRRLRTSLTKESPSTLENAE